MNHQDCEKYNLAGRHTSRNRDNMIHIPMNNVLKYGETTRGAARYSKSYLDVNNAYIDFVKKGEAN